MSERLDTLLDALRRRRSVRRFAAGAVDAALLDRILEAVRWAPSAGNRQAYRFLLLTDAAAIRGLAAAVEREAARLAAAARGDLAGDVAAYAASFSCFGAAPALALATFRPGVDLLDAAAGGPPARGPGAARADALASVSAATAYLLLAVDAVGLGACWMTGPLVAGDAIAAAAGVPAGWEVAALIPIGHPAEAPAPPPRRALAQLVRRVPGGEG